MATKPKQSRFDADQTAFGVSPLELYAPGNNPAFVPGTPGFTRADPRVPTADLVKTKTIQDQMAVQDAYELGSRHLLERMRTSPGSFHVVRKEMKNPVSSTGSIAILEVNENGRKASLLTPIANVIASTLDTGDVCLRDSQNTFSPTDHESITKSTKWEIVVGARSIEDPDIDGDQRNKLNYPMLKFFEKFREIEVEIFRMIAKKMIETYDEDTERCEFLPEVQVTDAINAALERKDEEALTQAILKGPFKSAVRHSELDAEDKHRLKVEYKKKNGDRPTEEYVEENMKVAYASDKMTFRTNCWQYFNDRARVDTSGYTSAAMDIFERNGKKQWIVPKIQRCDGESILDYKKTPIDKGDKVAVKFGLAISVYKTKGEVTINVYPQWTTDLLLYRKRKTSGAGGNQPPVKKIKLSGIDEDFSCAMAAQAMGATATVVASGASGDDGLEDF